MDLLVVVGGAPPPARLQDRSRQLHRLGVDESLETLVGSLRARIPRRIGVWGPLVDAAPGAAGLRRAGIPTELFTDEPIPPGVPPPRLQGGADPSGGLADADGGRRPSRHRSGTPNGRGSVPDRIDR